jgi:phenolic acid decarboxylase
MAKSFLRIPETVQGSGGVRASLNKRITKSSYNVVGPKTKNNVSVNFYHPQCGTLVVNTGLDQISWGYTLNTANYPTYGGEVVQILSCYIEDLRLQGTLTNYKDLEIVYAYFLTFIDNASADGTRDETPMKLYYDTRGWEFDIFVKNAPGYRKGRDVVAPQWMIEAHIIDTAGDVEKLSDLIKTEAEIKIATNGEENFGLEGKIRYIDENPFSDPNTKEGARFDQFDKVVDQYTKLLPSYLNGDFDALFANIGSKPSFVPEIGPKGVEDANQAPNQQLEKARKGKK